MHLRNFAIISLLLCGSLNAQTTQPGHKYDTWADHLDMIDTADAWSYGALENANVHPDYPARVELGYKELAFPRIGTWTGDIIQTKFPFTELLPSFNVTTPGKTGVVLEVRVQQGDAWSPWLYIQSWGRRVTDLPQRAIKFDGGKIDQDTLLLNKPATAYQFKLTLQSFDFETNRPNVRRLAVVYSGEVTDATERAKLMPPVKVPDNWARDLPVPFRAQGDYKIPKSLWSQICSPTSTSMVMEYYGINIPTIDNALAIYDPQFDLFGNWGRAVTRAGEEGLDAYLQRFRNWDQVKALIAEGTPIVASIRFKKGEALGFLYEFTKGHLIVIRGMTPQGDLIVNDPARRANGAHVIYKASEMAKAWFDHGGVGYVIRKPTTQPIAVRADDDN